jgi:hypothetical protein
VRLWLWNGYFIEMEFVVTGIVSLYCQLFSTRDDEVCETNCCASIVCFPDMVLIFVFGLLVIV